MPFDGERAQTDTERKLPRAADLKRSISYNILPRNINQQTLKESAVCDVISCNNY